MRVELLEPTVMDRLTQEEFERSLKRALKRYASRIGRPIRIGVNLLEEISGDHREYLARRFPEGTKRVVRAIPPGEARVKVEVSPEDLIYLQDPSGPLRFFRKACHEVKTFAKRLAREGFIRLYHIPCELTNFALGRFLPESFFGRPVKSLRMRRDSRGFRHVFGLARVSITLGSP